MASHREPSISTHVLDNERGQPAVGVRVTLARRDGEALTPLATAETDDDGRIGTLLPGSLRTGTYQIGFDTAGYFARQAHGDGEPPFLRAVIVEFEIVDTTRHYHVPLLLTRYACTSYRGS
ncbi:MAG: hydroxyisourate hydrolase [Chloroflexi bacterium]|nr:hydroxyisourate hydrolase [Chloroflexota bacterium]